MRHGESIHAAFIGCSILFSTLAGMGPAAAAPSQLTAPPPAENSQFKALFSTWAKGDGAAPQSARASIPASRPIDSFRYTSPFGVRVDPFRGNSSFHPGIDLAAPIGTPVHATGDAVVTRAGVAAGYGNLVILSHGAGIETRYGHLSRILVGIGQHVHPGDVIGQVGSTGRSTGSHLHYEIRVADRAINPLPFMAPGDEQLALNNTVGPSAGAAQAMGGPPAGNDCPAHSDCHRDGRDDGPGAMASVSAR